MTWYYLVMKTMLVSDFKAKAIATLKEVQSTGEPVVVTLRGQPLAEVVPVRDVPAHAVELGAGRGLICKLPDDKILICDDFDTDWEMNG